MIKLINKINGLLQFIIITSMIVLFLPIIYSTGISPASYNIDFQPGLEQEFMFQARNNLGQDTLFEISIEGPENLTQYFTLPKDKTLISKRNSITPFYIKMKLPNNIDTPGKNKILIGLIELKGSKEKISVKTGVKAPITIFVPYPGKYIDASLSAPNTNIGEDISLSLDITHRGSAKIDKVLTEFKIYQETQELISIQGPPELQVYPNEARKITAIIENNLKIGDYRIMAFYDYDGIKSNITTLLKIGMFMVKIMDYTTSFIYGEINKMDITVKNEWNKPIEETYADITINDKQGNTVASLKTPISKINPRNTITLTAYWDLTGVNQTGRYNADIVVHFDGNEERKTTILDVLSPYDENIIREKKINLLQASIIFLLIFTILITLFNVYYYMIRKHKDE